jgi:rhodanese-related sulfurtransferase
LSEVPRDRQIVVVCRSGNRSQEGRDILIGAGFEQVTSMAGGLSEWRANGFPIVP